MYYQYVAYTADKKIAKGTQVAASEDIASKILTSHGYKILSIKPVSAFLPKMERIFPSLVKVSADTMVNFSRQLALLHESGIDVVTSLELLRLQTGTHKLKDVIGDLIAGVRKGEKLSEAMSKHPEVFSKIYVQSVAVGEQTGNLEVNLRQMADYLDRESKASKSVKSAMRYPTILVIIAIAVVIVLTTVVFPVFTSLYASFKTELPAITKVTISIADWFGSYGYYLIMGIVIVAVALYMWSRTQEGKMQKDRVALKLPGIGKVIHLNELIRCCRSISMLYKAGLPIPDVLVSTIDNASNTVIKQALVNVHQNVLRGEHLSQAMSRSTLFLPMMTQMVRVGEATGNLDDTLMTVVESYETEAENKMNYLIGMIQPTVTLVLAVAVAFIAISLISSMYSLYGQMGG